MRALITSLPLLCAACASGPTAFAVGEVIGHYEMIEGPEICLQLHLAPHGRCTWNSWNFFPAVGPGQMTTVPGRWSIEHDRITIETESITSHVNAPYLGPATLNLRRWQGHVYLVPTSELRFFDDYGPMIECCFAKDGAPISAGPHAPSKVTRP